jgi:pimeloyl-ACP methyl ester carboxylesterase
VTTVVVHGAGSSGQAAARLLGCGPGALLVEDRSGDVEAIIDLIDATVAARSDVTDLMGISLGAHAIARWASRAQRPVPRVWCVLPAWTGDAGATAQVTAAAARAVADDGIATLLQRMHRDALYPDVVSLVQQAWDDYADDELARALDRASAGRGPTAEELAAIPVPVTVIGWAGDAFHPEDVVRTWGRHLRQPTLAIAARPETRLIRQALRTCAAPMPAPPAGRR